MFPSLPRQEVPYYSAQLAMPTAMFLISQKTNPITTEIDLSKKDAPSCALGAAR
jgi:hypothetical protein